MFVFFSNFNFDCIAKWRTFFCLKESKILLNLSINSDLFIFKSHNKYYSSNIRLVNFKLIYNAIPINCKFRNKYDKKCFMCKRNLNEDCEHIFINCERSKEFFEHVWHEYLHKKMLKNSIDLLSRKRGIAEKDYRALSCYVYSVWRIRNMCKHDETGKDLMNNFKSKP